jgi:hypothetical protein
VTADVEASLRAEMVYSDCLAHVAGALIMRTWAEQAVQRGQYAK